jgi:hypothetical protein
MYFKNKTAEFIFARRYSSGRSFTASGHRSDTDECIQHLFYPEIIHRTTEEYRGHLYHAGNPPDPDSAVNPIDQFHILSQLSGIPISNFLSPSKASFKSLIAITSSSSALVLAVNNRKTLIV